MFESVLLPAPFSPSSACTSPTAASKSTASFASTPGNRFVIPCIATAAPRGTAVAKTPFAVTKPLAGDVGRRLAWLYFGDGADDASDEPLHRVQVLDRQALALRD